MDILFRDKKLQKTFESVDALRRAYGDGVGKLSLRLQQLSAAETLADIQKIPSARLHALENKDKKKYKGYIAIDIKQPYRLICRPLNGLMSDFGTISAIEIVCVDDYH
jgi:plasmid maintenance system killer protein